MIRVNINKILEQKNKTAFWLSKETKIGYNNLKKLVDNETNAVKFENLEIIADVLECKIEDILEIVKGD
ncbi:helix-turn-helix transcriptional regulator [Clostridium tagluense]|uniref:helix-turn-helix domain-containing protein n=1 Tax=Clostridium tagluense TaxID=360422 RepID=UPI001CF5DA39|nr:helix-turn-helix transcriptional regulator [Clostridium tagluense]MCB2299613.1 helix-turn-helix transcriptional regulator [Clostridium tagluense]MCB2311643.1 helix-turn-helix transcriptional regulator [Clostridium tagluense]MCB2316367.1 helix-turn-helix transcriptional regulator [Clostridium tagluense]MCB2321249.1 helix-turn-helix transcriptional regulator [Clostridium tagluense]MCB2326236.1 helix-turn-helix transcriptional regulator [Clostridium tagluense]